MGVAGFFLPRAGTRAVLLAVVALAAALARAEESEEAVARIVVTAEPESEAEERAPTSFVTVIDVEERAAELDTTAEALAESVGVQVRRFGGLGAFSTISIRGSAPNQVQLYLDGIPLSRARNEVVNLSDLPIDSLQRIEVYRGTAPVGFGGGIGGVVNLVTKPPPVEPETEVAVSYGSFATRKVNVSHGRRLGGFELFGNLTYLGSEGDFTFRGEPEEPGVPANVNVRKKRINNESDSIDALLKAGYGFANGAHLDLTSETFWKDQGVPGDGDRQASTASFRAARTLNDLRLRHDSLLDGQLDTTANLYGVFQRDQLKDVGTRSRPLAELGGIRQNRKDDSTLIGGDCSGTYYGLPYNAWGAFAELSWERFDGFNAAATVPPRDEPDQERWSGALALQDRLGPFFERVLLVPTARWQHLRDKASATFNLNGQATGPPETRRDDLWSASLGAEIELSRWLALKGNIGRFQRAPNFSELYGNRGNVRGTPGLGPETALNRDVGFVARHPGWRWARDLNVEYAYFNNDIDDVIVLVQVSPNFFRAKNLGAARIRGHEVAARGTFGERLRLTLNYTNQDPENRSDSPEKGNRLPGRSEHEAYVRAELLFDRIVPFYEFDYLGDNFLSDRSLERIPARQTHGVGVTLSYPPWVTLTFEARNITDNQISDVEGFPLPGRSFFGTARVKF